MVVEKETTVEVDCNSVLVLIDIVIAVREVNLVKIEREAEGMTELEGCLIHWRDLNDTDMCEDIEVEVGVELE